MRNDANYLITSTRSSCGRVERSSQLTCLTSLVHRNVFTLPVVFNLQMRVEFPWKQDVS